MQKITRPRLLKYTLMTISLPCLILINHNAVAETYAPWLTQIGLTESVASAANWGKGIKIGIVDTGVLANSPFFASGQISKKLSSCAAVSFQCSNKYSDDHGHGTAVAAIAAGNITFPWTSEYGGYNVGAKNIVSVAPSANIIAEKVLNSAGSGYSTDVANGIRKAAAAGATVINVSITYGNTADVISSINYAASKGAYIVWAGGNSAINLLSNENTIGLTSAAINQLVFVGSVDANNVISDFSNTPGAGGLGATSATTAYANRWVMAPGENILAPYDPSTPATWGYWTGTSMSTPMISGSLALLQSTWPILKKNGAAANLLLATATDLGTEGVDSTYGYGIANLTKAFEPYGELTIKLNNNNIAVSSLTGAMISSGALGKLSKIKSKLAKYTTFDDFQRNFSVNLANLIQTPTAATLNALPSYKRTKPQAIKLADGTVMTTWQPIAATPFDHLGDFTYNASRDTSQQSFYMALDYKDGSTLAFGDGYSSQYAYSQAFFGDSEFAALSSELSASGFTTLADGGRMLSYGINLTEKMRMAIGVSNTANHHTQTSALYDSTPIPAEASNIKLGVSYQLNDQLTSGFTLAQLSEKDGLLGSQSQENSAIGFGQENVSHYIGFTAAYRLNQHNRLLVETGVAMTESAKGQGLIMGSSHIYSQAFGASFLSEHLFRKNDQLQLTIKQPLRVSAGSVGLLMAGVDEFGNATYVTEQTSLVPDGREIDYSISYDTPLTQNDSLNVQASFRQDVMNINGNHDVSIGASYSVNF